MPLIAALQMCSSHIIEENLKTAAKFIKEAAANNAKLIVLPEMFAIVGKSSNDTVKAQEAFSHGIIQSFLKTHAKEHQIWIVAGTIPITCEKTGNIKLLV